MAGTNARSESEKEKTKMRERQRRAITTKIFHGLRKHGGYRLSPRADINEVLRHLASEAGWLVEPDGTTYRSRTTNVSNCCSVCGGIPKASAMSAAAAATPSSSVVMGGCESSATASPSRLPAFNNNTTTKTSVNVYSTMYVYEGGLHNHNHQLHEARASNNTTPVASPSAPLALDNNNILQ